MAIQAYEGIKTYYIRYDVKSSKNKIIDDNLLMVPTENDFRAENFSHFSASGVISAPPGDPGQSVEQKIRDHAFKTILLKNGLKSVKTKDHDTVISYEGVVTTPLTILKHVYNEKQNHYTYKVQGEFSAIAFPDEWEKLSMKQSIKKMVTDFFNLFKWQYVYLNVNVHFSKPLIVLEIKSDEQNPVKKN